MLVAAGLLLIGQAPLVAKEVGERHAADPALDFDLKSGQCYVTNVEDDPFDVKLCDGSGKPYSETTNACRQYYFQCSDVYTPHFFYGALKSQDRGAVVPRSSKGQCSVYTVRAQSPWSPTNCAPPYPKAGCPGIACWVPVPGRQLDRVAYDCKTDDCVKLYDPAAEYGAYMEAKANDEAQIRRLGVYLVVGGGVLFVIFTVALFMCADLLGIRFWRRRNYEDHYKIKVTSARA